MQALLWLPLLTRDRRPLVGASPGGVWVRIHFELQNPVYDLVKSEERAGGTAAFLGMMMTFSAARSTINPKTPF